MLGSLYCSPFLTYCVSACLRGCGVQEGHLMWTLQDVEAQAVAISRAERFFAEGAQQGQMVHLPYMEIDDIAMWGGLFHWR